MEYKDYTYNLEQKWERTISVIESIKLDGINAKLKVASIELVKRTGLVHQFLRDIYSDDPTAFSRFEWTFKYRYKLMSMILESGHEVERNGKIEWFNGKGDIIAQMLTFHKNYETDPCIKQLISDIENQLEYDNNELAYEYLKFAHKHTHDVIKQETLNNKFIDAAEKGDKKAVISFLKRGAEFHADYDNALPCAARNGHKHVVEFLIKNGANVNTQDDSALIGVAAFGHKDIVDILIKNGADIHAQNDWALGSASQNGHIDIVDLLLKNGANIHAQNDRALIGAALHKRTETIYQIIIEHNFKLCDETKAKLVELNLTEPIEMIAKRDLKVNFEEKMPIKNKETVKSHTIKI